jgi:XTP/dITP diphosphohydrolase
LSTKSKGPGLLQIVIASKNTGKIKEIKSYVRRLPKVEWLTFKDFKSFPDIEEKEGSFLENAKIKAKAISDYTGMITLADDSGLEVEFLGGRPGVRSSRYAGENASDKENRDRLMAELSDAKSISDRGARFVCSMVLWEPKKGSIFMAKGLCSGHIGFKEKGTGGFGYDCIFIPSSYNRTMAQLDKEEKNRISHRGKAIRAVCEFIVNF